LEDKKTKPTVFWTILLLCLVAPLGLAKADPVGTAFTYQGRLIDANEAADGLYDFQFKLFDAETVGNQLGSDVNTPDVNAVDGYFSVVLDFGSVFDGNARWLEIGVRPGEQNDPCVYTFLSPRQKLTATPYALYAKTAGSGGGGGADSGWSYIIFIEGTTIKAKNGTTGQIDFSGTDARTVIQAAINASTSGIVLLKDAIYSLDGSETLLSIPSNVTVKGESREGTILKVVDGCTATKYIFVNGDYVQIRSLTINGNRANINDQNVENQQCGILVYSDSSAKHVVIENVYVHDTHSIGIFAIQNSDNVRITGNRLENTDDSSIQASYVSKGIISNNLCKACNAGGGIELNTAMETSVVGNRVENCFQGIRLYTSNNNTITGNVIKNATNSGIYLNNSNKNAVSGNIVDTGCSNTGIFVYNSANSNSIVGNVISNMSWYGIELIISQYNVIAGNSFDTININAIGLQGASYNSIEGNMIKDAGVLANNSYYGIILWSSEATHSLHNNILDNYIISVATNKIRYGIMESNANQNYQVVRNNKVVGAVVAGILIQGANTKAGYNIGYVTENSGTATITAGQTSVNVTHGLAAMPTRVQLTPTTDTAGKRYWISAKGATTFTITIDSTHTSDITFDWRAVVGEDN
jgi:parallel beta-helix repeat protein